MYLESYVLENQKLITLVNKVFASSMNLSDSERFFDADHEYGFEKFLSRKNFQIFNKMCTKRLYSNKSCLRP